MILKMMNTNNGNVLIDNIEHITRVGITRDCGDTIELTSSERVGVILKREDVLHDILSLYNLSPEMKVMNVFNLVIRSNNDNRKEFRTVVFRGPGFLMNDAGFTMENYEVPE